MPNLLAPFYKAFTNLGKKKTRHLFNQVRVAYFFISAF